MKHLVRIGQQLERTTAHLRWCFKEVEDWERDQMIIAVAHVHGPSFVRNMSIADKVDLE